MRQQKISNQKGEIEFRKRLYLHQVGKENAIENEFDSVSIEQILLKRMEKTLDQITQLKKEKIYLSPYLEIGAERCQRSLVMENDLGLSGGASADISFDMLKSCEYYKGVFKKDKAPIRVCCDANNLPFKTSSIPFVFLYETLHHFPDPHPITTEIYRVLQPGGYFFFDEEPVKRILHLNLYKGEKMYSKTKRKKNYLRRVLDYFFREQNCNETEYGIIENQQITLRAWKRALKIFDKRSVVIESIKNIQSDLFRPSSYLSYFIIYLFGSSISGLLQKDGVLDKEQIIPISSSFICPECKVHGMESLLNRNTKNFVCSKCSKKYPVIDQVLFLFKDDTFLELYPEVFNSIKR